MSRVRNGPAFLLLKLQMPPLINGADNKIAPVIASRTENMAEPGTTYVSEDTFKLAEGLFRFEAIGKKHIKGIDKHVGIFRVIAPSTRKTRFDVNTELGPIPLQEGIGNWNFYWIV